MPIQKGLSSCGMQPDNNSDMMSDSAEVQYV